MALTDEEALSAFRYLRAVLRNHDLDWVLTQVEEKIALGKVQTKKLPAQDAQKVIESLWETTEIERSRSKASALFAVAEEYAPQERLAILLDSISLAVPIVHKVADATLSNLQEVGATGVVAFEPDADIRSGFSLSREEILAHYEANGRLMKLVNELRETL